MLGGFNGLGQLPALPGPRQVRMSLCVCVCVCVCMYVCVQVCVCFGGDGVLCIIPGSLDSESAGRGGALCGRTVSFLAWERAELCTKSSGFDIRQTSAAF